MTRLHKIAIDRQLAKPGPAIRGFTDRYSWLSLSAPGEVWIPEWRLTFPTRMHAYQAAKLEGGNRILLTDPAADAIRIGRAVPIPSGWYMDKSHAPGTGLRDDWMKKILVSYFLSDRRNLVDSERLLQTGYAYLENLRRSGDVYWGVSAYGGGENKLGFLLMEIRKILQEGNDV